MASRFRKAVSSTLAFSLIYSSLPIETAKASCGAATVGGSGPPSISATEVSTAQALEVLRRRKDEQQQPIVVASLSQQPPAAAQAVAPPPPVQPATPAPKPQASAVPAGQGGAPGAASSAAPKPAKKLVKKAAPKAAPEKKAPAKEKTEVATAESAAPVYRGGSLKDDSVSPPSPSAGRGAWVQGYYDYERQRGWTFPGDEPGKVVSKEQTSGVLAGVDYTLRPASSGAALTVGVLGGYQETRTRYSDSTFQDIATTDTWLRTRAKDTTEGGVFGVYGLYVQNNFAVDLLFKADVMNLEQRDFISQKFANCGFDTSDRTNTADELSLILAGNAARRIQLSGNTWLEPTAGFRYTHIDYSNIRHFSIDIRQSGIGVPPKLPALDFGLTDGDILRIQGGLRFGFAHQLSADRIWVMTIGGFLYSDVWIDGISADYRDLNEGKLRVMGQLTSALAQSNGLTYLLQGEVRGGEDLIGVGVKGGFRYEW